MEQSVTVTIKRGVNYGSLDMYKELIENKKTDLYELKQEIGRATRLPLGERIWLIDFINKKIAEDIHAKISEMEKHK